MGKYLLAAIAVFIICGQASAQIEKNNFYPGISFHRSEANLFGIRPSASIGLGKHGMIGLHSSFIKGRSNYYTDSRFYGVSKGIGIDYSYFHFFKNSQRFGWFATTGFNYQRISGYQVKNNEKLLINKYGQTDIYLKPGIFYKPTSHVMIFANFGGIGLQSSRGNNDFDLSFATEVNIGVMINLDIFRKKK